MKDMITLAKQFNSVMDDFFARPVYDDFFTRHIYDDFFTDFRKSTKFNNRVKFVEDENSITYFTELPGVPKEDIKIYLEDVENKKSLVIEYDIEDKILGKKDERIVTLLNSKKGIVYDFENIDATLENGILKVKFNKISVLNNRIEISLK